MVHALTATLVSHEEDEENLVFAFSADEAGAGQYVMFQHALSQEGKGIPPGQEGLYIECDDQSRGCYQGVESIRRIDDHIEIRLNNKGQQRLQVRQVHITPMPWNASVSHVLARLAALSGGEYEVLE